MLERTIALFHIDLAAPSDECHESALTITLNRRQRINMYSRRGHMRYSVLLLRRRLIRLMEQQIVGFHQDSEQHWVAELECGHDQHVRHDPPWINRPWVTTSEGRAGVLGRVLACRKCDAGASQDCT